MPKNDQIWPKIGIFGQFGLGHAGLFGALLVGRLVVVARGLYLARHLFTLFYYFLKETSHNTSRNTTRGSWGSCRKGESVQLHNPAVRVIDDGAAHPNIIRLLAQPRRQLLGPSGS